MGPKRGDNLSWRMSVIAKQGEHLRKGDERSDEVATRGSYLFTRVEGGKITTSHSLVSQALHVTRIQARSIAHTLATLLVRIVRMTSRRLTNELPDESVVAIDR